MLAYADIDIFILAGGQGRRVKPLLKNTPKILAQVGNQTMLECLFDWLYSIGGKHVVLGLGVGSAQVIEFIAEHPYPQLHIDWSTETEPLGTAGAVRHASRLLRSDPVLIVNGDTLIDVDMLTLLKHQQRFRAAMLVVNATNVSAGACLMPRGMLDRLVASDEVSLEKFLAGEYLVRFRCHKFQDIGTPDGLRRVQA